MRINETQTPSGGSPACDARDRQRQRAGKTTLTRGIVEALGRDRSTSIRVDDSHRYDRQERKQLPVTPLHPTALRGDSGAAPAAARHGTYGWYS